MEVTDDHWAFPAAKSGRPNFIIGTLQNKTFKPPVIVASNTLLMKHMSSVLLSNLSTDAIITHICQDANAVSPAGIPVFPGRSQLPANSVVSTRGSATPEPIKLFNNSSMCCFSCMGSLHQFLQAEYLSGIAMLSIHHSSQMDNIK